MSQEPWHEKAEPISKGISGEAQKALVLAPKMASEGTLTMDQIQTAKDASRESVAKLTEELKAQGYPLKRE